MAEHRPNPPDETEPTTSQAFRDDLAALFDQSVPVPAEVDHAILAQARRQLRPRPSPWRVLRWPAAAAAAALLLAVLLPTLQRASRRAPAPAAAERSLPLRGDIDGDGRVDILDAFALARRLKAREALDAACDINGDGAVNRADVDTVATAAVRLNRGPM